MGPPCYGEFPIEEDGISALGHRRVQGSASFRGGLPRIDERRELSLEVSLLILRGRARSLVLWEVKSETMRLLAEPPGQVVVVVGLTEHVTHIHPSGFRPCVTHSIFLSLSLVVVVICISYYLFRCASNLRHVSRPSSVRSRSVSV